MYADIYSIGKPQEDAEANEGTLQEEEASAAAEEAQTLEEAAEAAALEAAGAQDPTRLLVSKRNPYIYVSNHSLVT